MLLMSIPQSGIFALGTASHAYLEFEARSNDDDGTCEPRRRLSARATTSSHRWRASGA